MAWFGAGQDPTESISALEPLLPWLSWEFHRASDNSSDLLPCHVVTLVLEHVGSLGGGRWAGGMKSLLCFSVPFSWEDFHNKGVCIFRISMFCFSVVNIHFKPTIFRKGLIIHVGKLVSSCHFLFLVHPNSPLQLRMAISPTPGKVNGQEKLHYWSWVGAEQQGKPL